MEIENKEVTEELIANLAKNIFKADLVSDKYFTSKFKELSEEDFLKRFNKSIEMAWQGSSDIDELERERYKLLALAALHTLGYKVEISNQPARTVLV